MHSNPYPGAPIKFRISIKDPPSVNLKHLDLENISIKSHSKSKTFRFGKHFRIFL